MYPLLKKTVPYGPKPAPLIQIPPRLGRIHTSRQAPFLVDPTHPVLHQRGSDTLPLRFLPHDEDGQKPVWLALGDGTALIRVVLEEAHGQIAVTRRRKVLRVDDGAGRVCSSTRPARPALDDATIAVLGDDDVGDALGDGGDLVRLGAGVGRGPDARVEVATTEGRGHDVVKLGDVRGRCWADGDGHDWLLFSMMLGLVFRPVLRKWLLEK